MVSHGGICQFHSQRNPGWGVLPFSFGNPPVFGRKTLTSLYLLIDVNIEKYREQYQLAQSLIDSARDLLDTELTALSGESYQRAYGAMVSVQMLAELEEVIQYKILAERRPAIRKMWWKRLQVTLV